MQGLQQIEHSIEIILLIDPFPKLTFAKFQIIYKVRNEDHP